MDYKKDLKRRKKIEKHGGKEKREYHFKSYVSNYIILYPVMIVVHYCNVFAEKFLLKWDEEKALKIIDKYLLKICDYEDNTYFYCTEWGHRIWYYKASNPLDKIWLDRYSGKIHKMVKEQKMILPEGWIVNESEDEIDGNIWLEFHLPVTEQKVD